MNYKRHIIIGSVIFIIQALYNFFSGCWSHFDYYYYIPVTNFLEKVAIIVFLIMLLLKLTRLLAINKRIIYISFIVIILIFTSQASAQAYYTKEKTGLCNAYVDAGYAVADTAQAAQAVKDAQQQLDKIKKLNKQGKATDKAVQHAQANLAAATTNLGIAAIKTAEAAANAAGAASTSMGTGLYADLRIDAETTETKTQEQTVKNLASSLIAGKSITLTAGADITQKGSDITSQTGDITYNTGQNLKITASQDNYDYASATQTKTASLTIGSTNPNALLTNDIGGGIGYGTQTQTATATTNNNSGVTAAQGKITIKTGNNADIAGANLLAKEINAEIAGDLTVESLQDQHYSYGNSNNFNIGYNTGSGASIGAGYGKNNADSKWVNEQTTIIGTTGVNINTAGTTDITGAVIANINKNGIDTGNLAINAGILTYANINDYDTSQNSGLNIAVSDIETENNHITGNAQIAIKNTGHQKEGKTKATIGAGTITTANNADTTNLNRDITQTQTETQNTITAALDAETAFDLRLLSEAGRQEIAQDFINLPRNIAQIGKGITNNIISQSIKNSITDQNKNLIDNINQYITDDQKIALIQTDTELTENLNGLTNLDALYLQYALQNTADIAGANGEFTGNLQLYALLNSGKGYSYTDQYGNIIGINTLKTNLTDSADTINVLFHETTNYADHTQNEQTAINRGDTAQAIWVLKNFENKNTNTITTQDWNDQNYNSPVILYGNLQYENANKNNINNWFTPDTFADIGFISYDLYKILIDNLIGDQTNLKENIIALSADTAGLFIPLATGLGTATKTANKIDNVVDVTAKADEAVEGVAKYGDEAVSKKSIKNKIGSNKKAKKQVNSIADKYKMDKQMRHDFGDYIETKKAMEGRGGADNYSYKELDKIAKEFLEIK